MGRKFYEDFKNITSCTMTSFIIDIVKIVCKKLGKAQKIWLNGIVLLYYLLLIRASRTVQNNMTLRIYKIV